VIKKRSKQVDAGVAVVVVLLNEKMGFEIV